MTDCYRKFKGVLNCIFGGELEPQLGIVQLIEIFSENGVRLRKKDQHLIRVNFLNASKEIYQASNNTSIAIGLVYVKPDKTLTQDMFIIHKNGLIEYCRNEKDLVKYPALKGMHKKVLSIAN